MRHVLFFLLVMLLLPAGSSGQKTNEATYEVYALSYGIYPNFPVSGLIAGADKDRKIDLQMMVWLLRGPGEETSWSILVAITKTS